MLHRSLFTVLTIVVAITAVAQLTCSTALMVTAGSHSVPGIFGSQSALPICIVQSNSATAANWYRYTPAQDFAITISTDLPQNEGRDTRFHVYTGNCSALDCVIGDDDSGSDYLSMATFNATAGNIYYIAFDDYWDDQGFDFELTEAAPLPMNFIPESLPTGGLVKCVVDMNGDFLDDVVRVPTTYVTILHQNASGGFTASTIPSDTADFTPSWSIAAGDLTGNDYNDLLYGGGQGVAFMLANNNGTAFTEYTGPEYVFSQRSNFVDINNDGHLDAFVCHDVLPNVYYINDGTGDLTFGQGGLGDTPDGGNYGSIWIDYDNDGDLDVLITSRLHYAVGETGRTRGPGIYRNERGTFVRTSDSLPQAWYGDWIDFDGDGDLDVLLNGLDGGGTYAQVIENVDGSFNTSSARFGGVWFGDVAIGDLDADGRVDFVMNGRYQMSSYQANRFLIYRNAGTSAQSAPPPPVGLAARRNGDLLVLSWTSPNPNIEIGPSYTYNVRVGTTPGGSEILAPMAMSSGKRLVTKQGNAGHNHTITLKGMRGDLPYYWSVQTVDHRQVGSAFAPERVAYATQAPPRSAPIITENYPNPFNPSTTIRYTLPATSDVRVVVYNVLGAEVAELVNSRMESGAHEAVWSGIDAAGRPVPSGVYLYAVETAGERIVRSMLLLK